VVGRGAQKQSALGMRRCRDKPKWIATPLKRLAMTMEDKSFI